MKVEANIQVKQTGCTHQYTLTQSQYKALIEEKLERARLMVQNQRRTERRQQQA